MELWWHDPDSPASWDRSVSTTHATPWDALLRHPAIRLRPDAEPGAQDARQGTKLARVLAELAQLDNIPTLALCVRCDLERRQVWGLLKAPRAAGQVTFSAGRWALNRDWRGRDIERAAPQRLAFSTCRGLPLRRRAPFTTR